MSTLTGGAAPTRPIPRSPEIKQYLYSNAVLGETRRFRTLDRYEAHYSGTQYDHLQHDWWGLPADNMETVSPEIQVPFGFAQPALDLNVRQKRPTAPTNLCKAIVDRFTGLLFSDRRRPTIMVENDPDTEDFVLAAIDQMRFWAKMREARAIGGASGSVMITSHLRAGKFSLEVHNPKHLQIVWKDRRTLQPLAMLKCYRYPVEEEGVDGKTGERSVRIVEYLYRRIITEHDDTVYKPVKLEPGANLQWEVESTVEHNLGFFPGVWIQNRAVLDQEDGEPDCYGTWQSLDTMDRIIAQMNKAVMFNLDPTLALSIDPRVVEMQGGSVRKGSDNALVLGQGGAASYLEITGSGVEAGMKVVTTLKQNILDVSRCVLVDPSTISGSAQSAKAIEYIYAPMLEAADDLRAQYGDLGIVPLLQVVERIARKFSGNTVKLDENKIGRYAFSLPPRMEVTPVPEGAPPEAKPEVKAVPRRLGPGGHIKLDWGPYFAPTDDDKSKAINNVVAAKTGSLIDQETAVRQTAPIFGIRDPDAVLKKVKEEQEQQMSMMGGFGGGVPPGFEAESDDEEGGPPAGGGGRP